VQGYNAQALVGEGQIVLAAEISTESLDTGNLEPMVAAAYRELAAAGVNETPGVLLADAGYWRGDAIEQVINEHHVQILIAPDADKRKGPRPGRRGGLYDFARRILATERGTELYRKRQGQVEPVFAQIKHNRGVRRFSRRGRSAVRSEWRLLTATHNRRKLHQYRVQAASEPTTPETGRTRHQAARGLGPAHDRPDTTNSSDPLSDTLRAER
jgi:hypothetical protein